MSSPRGNNYSHIPASPTSDHNPPSPESRASSPVSSSLSSVKYIPFSSEKVVVIDSVFTRPSFLTAEEEYSSLVKRSHQLQRSIRLSREIYKDFLNNYRKGVEIALETLKQSGKSTTVASCKMSSDIDHVLETVKRDYLDFIEKEASLTFRFTIEQTKLFRKVRDQVELLANICRRIVDLRPDEFAMWEAAVEGSKWYLIS